MAEFADLLVTNARVYTVDESNPWAEAVAVRGNRIAFVGSAADAEMWQGPQTRVIDGAGRTLLPGFIDSHFHLLHGSLKLDDLDLETVTDLDDLAGRVRAHAEAHPDREWVLGYQVRYNMIGKEQSLDRHFLDAIVADRPVLLQAFDAHTSWANTVALERAGILHGRDLPPGHEIVMDPETGMATGELREPEATKPVRNLVPPPSAEQKRALLKKGLARAASLGLTGVHNMDGDTEQIELYAALEDLGEMTLRVYVPYSVRPETPVEALDEAAEWAECYQGSHVRSGAVKYFMDGVLESTTALMIDDYADAPGNRGAALFTAEHFNKMAAESDRRGLQIFVHCCGDGAVQRTLDGYEHVRAVNGPRDSRHRVEHIEVIHPDDIGRFAELDVIASMQPLHGSVMPSDDNVWANRAGPQRWALSFAWQTLREAGAHLAFGSDWPVVSMDPMLGIHRGLNRQLWQPGDPDQRQSLEDLIVGYTADAAYAEFQENEKGRIRMGMLADLVLLSADLFETPVEAVAEVRPVLTVCDGRVVYEDL